MFATTVLAIGGTLFAAWVSSSPPVAYLAGFTIAEALALAGVLVALRAGGSAVAPGTSGAPELAGHRSAG
jgi:hypothetical protein